MGKFYVQSGNLKRVINSQSAERAAMWVVHQAMQQIAPQFRDERDLAAGRTLRTDDPIVVLDDTIIVSEIGFSAGDSIEIETFTAFRKWYAMCETIGI